MCFPGGSGFAEFQKTSHSHASSSAERRSGRRTRIAKHPPGGVCRRFHGVLTAPQVDPEAGNTRIATKIV